MAKAPSKPQQHTEDVCSQLADCMGRIYRLGMTTSSGGNCSARAADGRIWVTPAQIDKASLTPEDMVAVTLDGQVMQGAHRPTSELPFHLAIYRARPDLCGIVHAHPAGLVAYSAAGRTPQTRLLPRAHNFCGPVGLAPYAAPGSDSLAAKVADQFRGGTNCVLLQNHGVVVGGTSLGSAFLIFETLEVTARTILTASKLGPIPEAPQEQKSGTSSSAVPSINTRQTYQPSTTERGLRHELCHLLARGCHRRLFTGACGVISVRMDEKSMLITPATTDRALTQPAELCWIHQGTCQVDRRPDPQWSCHQAIYDRHPDIGCIIHATPINVSAHSIGGTIIRTDLIPESYLVLRSIQLSEFAYQHSPALADKISMKQPVLMIRNDGVLIAGRCPIDAFDRLEVLESTAESLIACKVFGQLDMLSTDVLAQLNAALPESYGAIRKPDGDHLR